MISVSAEALEIIQDGRPFVYECLFTLADGTQFTLTEDDMQTGCRINAPSGSSSLPLGCAISRCLELSFFNTDDQYEDYDFFGATIAVTAKLQLSETVETFDLGLFTVTEPETYGRTISIAAYDAFYKADRTYETNRTFPMTAGELFSDACDKSGLIPYSSVFANSDYVVQKKPANMSCRQVIGYCAMLACGNAVVDGNEVKIIGYTQVSQQAFNDPIRQTLALSDVAVTGVAYSNGTETTTLGTSGYVLTVSNPLYEGNELDALQRMYNILNGFTFRPFELTTPSYPFAQNFDACTVYDRETACNTFITDIQFNFKGATTLKCSADSPIRNNSKGFTSNVATVQKLREVIVEERGLRERVEEDLSQRLDNASGFYTTTERTQSGGYIYYIHDKPTMAESQKVWMMTENAWGVSSDGGQTWNAGLTVDGVLLTRILSAEGISADWITSGRLEVTNNGSPIFYADKDTGSVYISGDNVYIGDQPATEALAELSGALTITLSNEMQGIPVDSNGDYAEFPATSTDIRVIYGSQDVTSAATLTHGTFNVTGSIIYNSSAQKYIYTVTGLSEDTGYVVFNATYNNGTTTVSASRKFNLYKAYAGQTGPEGIARVYFVEPTASIIKQGINDSHSPGSVTFYSYYREGTSATRYAYPALFRIEVLRENASEWETVIEPTENKASETYTITDADITSVKCTLLSYADFNDVWWGLSPDGSAVFLVDNDGNMLEMDHTIEIIEGGEQIDISTVPIVKDISGLTQDKVFDILTDGGNLQGMWYLNGNVYFNAAYIATGILRSVSGNTYWNLDTGMLNIENGAINLGNGNFVVTSAGALTAKNANIKGSIEATSLTLSGNAAIPYSKISGTPNLNVYIQKDGTIGTYPSSDSVTGFVVSSAGLLRAANAIIYGTIYAKAGSFTGSVTANSLTLGSSVTIPYSKLTGTPNLSVYVAKDGTIGSTPSDGATGFKVTSAGLLTASNAVIYGTIYASAGTIGGCTISNNVLQIKSANITGTLTGKTISGGEIIGRTKISSAKIFGTQIEGTSVGTDSGDETYIRLKNGTMHIYQVLNTWKYEEQDGSDAEIISRLTHVASITATKSYRYDDFIATVYHSDINSALRNDPYDESAYDSANWFRESVPDSILYKADVMHAFRIGSTKAAFFTDRDVVLNKPTTITQNTFVHGNLYVKGVRTSGTKSRTVQTEDYGKRLLYAYETPAPLFGDVGDGVINEDGLCYIQIEPAFLETVKTSQYQVFLQAYGDGKCYVKERKSSYFVVAGDPGLEFGWEMKAKQIDFAQLRLERDDPDVEMDNTKYGEVFEDHIKDITVDYGTNAADHIEEVNEERTRA